jgi:CDP-glycerol glycerophosphotransferase (TagB/SpsB family)
MLRVQGLKRMAGSLERRLANRLLRAVCSILVAVAVLIPKRKTLVLFGDRLGDHYADNSRHLFEWMLAHRKDIDAVWVSRKRTVLDSLKRSGRAAVDSRSLRGRWLLSRASVGIVTCRLADIALDEASIPGSLKVVFLTHGKSVKGTCLASRDPAASANWRRRLPRFSEVTRFAIATSPFTAELTEASYGVRAVVTGYPRNDILLSGSEASTALWKEFVGGQAYDKVVLYGPSWRHGRTPARFFPFGDFDRASLFDFLKSRRLLLLLRPHVEDLFQFPTLRAFINDLTAEDGSVRSASHDVFPDVSMLLHFVDVLISDYSSLYHDFLLLDRPLMFVPYDYDEFEQRDGFMYDYFEHLPGPAVTTFRDFCRHLDLLCLGDDPFRAKRQALRDMVHTYRDSGSRERVAALLDRVLQGDGG